MAVVANCIMSRNLRDRRSTSATLAWCLLLFFGATGTGSGAASPASGTAGYGFVITSGAFAGCAAAQGESGPCDQAGDAKTGQDLF
jgi:hypothetical protein